MALQIDDDWKRQAQEEKRKLAEEAKAREEAAAASRPAATASGGAGATTGRARELPPADFSALVQSMLTQADYSLGAYAGADGEPVIDLDAAKFQIDLLGIVEHKSKGNLSETEQGTLDAALYELRSRYVSIATQMIR